MRGFAGLLLAVLAAATSAQEPSEEFTDSWYRIELLIFANRDPEAALSERWPLLPQLAYPETWRSLETGDPRQPADRPFELQTVEDSAPGPVIDLLWDRSIEQLEREYRQKQLTQAPTLALEPLVAMETPLDVPRQRVLLPPETRELNAQRRRIDASAGLEVLMHESWLQRIPSREVALPLILDGPVQFGDYPELQGSVLFYSGRYLHIATDLWLNTAGSYLDAEPTSAGWSMPRPPLPLEQAAAQLLPFRVEVGEDWFTDLELPGRFPEYRDYEDEPDGLDDIEAEELDSRAGISAVMPPRPEASDSTEEPGEEPETAGPSRFFRFGDAAEAEEEPSHPPATEAEMEAFLAREVYNYDFRHAVRVSQQRRMRSGELHYIDHPLLGIVVKITRHEFLPFTGLDEFEPN
ncbi:MAG: CsiV family protein [Halieaceae bacterium]|nr:CsiV family protein [Halieaceae bacterium]